jgi:hypothetical protein
MKDLILGLTTDLPEAEPPKTTTSDDLLGSMLQSKWDAWSTARRQIEEGWLQDLRAFNQQNEPDVEQLSKFHSHIYLGITRTKCLAAYSRIADLMFQSRDRHWGIEPTPIPESEQQKPENDSFMDEMQLRAEAMADEIADRMIDMHYEDNLKTAILEGCILGTGCVKGIITTVKKLEKWAFHGEGELAQWTVVKSEIPAPQMSAPSIFDIYPDPYANRVEDMSGVFERHTLNRQQFADLRNDERFDKDKINEILKLTDKGNHQPLYHETQRRTIAGITDATASTAERYDLLEYWGQVSGRLLSSAGVETDEDETQWANVWTCAGKTLLAKVSPIVKQKIPYQFFIYNKVPHQFWGVSPARMMKHTQAVMNGTTRSLLDGMALASAPMAEVNVPMLKDGQDPRIMKPGQIWLRDNGDPTARAVHFFQPNIPTGQLMQMAEMFKGYADDETAIPAYTYGDQSQEINKTAQGLSMQMSAASLPIKSVVKNLEDFCIRPFITSLFDWLMQWSDREEIKGDMQVSVLGTSALMAKETRSQQLMQFLNITANPIDTQYVDRKYLLTQIAKSLEIDTKKAVPEQMPEQGAPPQDSALDQARATLIQVQTEKEKALIDKAVAETAQVNVATQFSATQAAQQLLLNPAVVNTADQLLGSAGYVDKNGQPLADTPVQQPVIDNVPQNTSPQFPPLPQSPEQALPEAPQTMMQPGMDSAMAGIETTDNENIKA